MGGGQVRIYKIKEYPDRGKVVESDTFIPFCWVGDLSLKRIFTVEVNKQQKEAISKHGILNRKIRLLVKMTLDLINGLTYMIKTTKSYRDLVSFFRQGGFKSLG